MDFIDALAAAKLSAFHVDVDELIEEVERVTPDDFEEQYQKIGWWKGPYATSSAREGRSPERCSRCTSSVR